MDDNLKLVAGAFQAVAELYEKLIEHSVQLRKMPHVKETAINMWWRYYDTGDKIPDNPPRTVIEASIEVDLNDNDEDPVIWELDISFYKDFVDFEGRVYRCFESHDQNWLEVNRKADNLNQFLSDLNEVADELLKFPVPDLLLNGSIKE